MSAVCEVSFTTLWEIAVFCCLLTDLQSEQIKRRCFPLQNWVKYGGRCIVR